MNFQLLYASDVNFLQKGNMLLMNNIEFQTCACRSLTPKWTWRTRNSTSDRAGQCSRMGADPRERSTPASMSKRRARKDCLFYGGAVEFVFKGCREDHDRSGHITQVTVLFMLITWLHLECSCCDEYSCSLLGLLHRGLLVTGFHNRESGFSRHWPHKAGAC
jgi:hypothetical protein